VHEGGIATPLIAHWPNGISARGKLDPQPGHITDIMPTCLELARARYRSGDHKHLPDLVGKSLVPSFSDGSNERGCVFWEHEGNRALRKGRWKLVAKGVAGPWELYDMVVDRSEQNDLASTHQDIVDELAGEWERIAGRTYVFPLDGRGWEERIESPVQDGDAEQGPIGDA
jgi:arylsulfatase